MFNKIFQYVTQLDMIKPGDCVVAGVSGGADSVSLFLVLCKLRKKIPFDLRVVHVNHGIRKEAGADEAYVKELCDKEGIPFYGVKADVKEVAAKQSMSVEEAGRWVRYQAFTDCFPKDLIKERAKIAVAHHMDDRAETLLFHLARGSGLKGLGGIMPIAKRKDGSTIIRPLLCVERREIEQYLEKEGISYCTDSTNDEDDYTRNRIRHHILPMMKDEISKSVVQNMNRTMDLLLSCENFIVEEARKTRGSCVQRMEKTEVFSVEAFKSYHPYLQRQIIRDVLSDLTVGLKDITAKHVEDILSLFLVEKNRRIHLPYGLMARREYEKVYLYSTEDARQTKKPDPVQIPIELADLLTNIEDKKEYIVPVHDGQLVFSLLNYEKKMNIVQNRYTKWFDCDKISKSMEIRNRKTGDYFTINEDGNRKSLKDYMINEKIPKDIRDELPLLAENNHVIWLIGYRISSFYKVDTNTKHVLQVEYIGGKQHG